jgi:putative nucleotidyltransferase with HDIG domain
MLGLRSRVISIEQAAVLLGAERLRSLAMTCSLLTFEGNALPHEALSSFWRHNFLAALLAEELAVHQDYFEKEQAYLAGLLHDIGRLPQYMLAIEEQAKNRTVPSKWADKLAVEQDYFGTNHCVLGGRMAKSWNFMPSFIDVLENHHDPAKARHDPVLVDTVGSIERFLFTKPTASLTTDGHSDKTTGEAVTADSLTYEGFHLLNDPTIVEMLNAEYERLLPLLQVGLPGLTEADD